MASQSSLADEKSKLRRELGFWDVLLFNIACVLGPRWIAAAAHNGTSSLSLWFLAAVLFFVPTALVIVELSTRYPAEGGLYVWTKLAFGDFHGFLAGWCYWIYTFFYFPGLLMASVAMSVYVGGPKYAWLADNRTYLLGASLGLLTLAVVLNLIGLNIGKWLQNAGGVATYVPLLLLVGLAGFYWTRGLSVTTFTTANVLPHWNWGTVNFWSQIAFAFTGLELVCAMSEEVKQPRRTFPHAIYGAAILIALIYILGTAGVLAIIPAAGVNVQNGVFQALGNASARVGLAWIGIMAALLVTVGNAGGVGATVAGVARIPFVAGIDRYLPAAFGRIHSRWRTPYVAILVQAILSAVVLLLFQIKSDPTAAYQQLVDVAIIIYFLPFLYMYAAVIRLAYQPDREANAAAVLVPGGKSGVWVAGILGFAITLLSMVLSLIPPETANTWAFEFKVVAGTVASVFIGLMLYWRGRSAKQLLPVQTKS